MSTAPHTSALALERFAGPALVLDPELRIVLATPRAPAALGMPIPIGISAPKLLCGTGPVRPVAEALAAGAPVRALISLPGKSSERTLEVEAEPLIEEGERRGWILRLRELASDASAADGSVDFLGIWSRDPRMKEVFRLIERVAPTDVTALVRGETGTGKELVAEAIHRLSHRRNGPFRAINCAALAPALLESELFGHVRGAFTGAINDRPGHVRLADGGTLFLDEIAEIPLDMQAKLLRMIQSRSVVPVGGHEPVPVDVRIISATHRSLRAEVAAGRFRPDLMYRLRVLPIFLPPLRERGDDVVLIAERLLGRLALQGSRKVVSISKPARARMLAYGWPGNVRELINALEYALVVGDGAAIEASHLPPEISGAPAAIEGAEPSPADAEPDPELKRIRRALERTSGHKDRAAKLLGMSRTTLWRKLRELESRGAISRRSSEGAG